MTFCGFLVPTADPGCANIFLKNAVKQMTFTPIGSKRDVPAPERDNFSLFLWAFGRYQLRERNWTESISGLDCLEESNANEGACACQTGD
jgi:hypothetical protein